MTSLLKALIVEDNEAFLRFICSTLQETSQFQVMQASDGLEAVRMAEETQPDLVLLDIGLPELSGIEAGRRIRRLAPHAKLLFVSSESAPDVVRKTFRPGGGLMLIKLAVIAICFPPLKQRCRASDLSAIAWNLKSVQIV